MDEFISKQFSSPEFFLNVAVKAATVQWSFKSGMILQIEGTNEFPDIFAESDKCNGVENQHIYTIIPRPVYEKIFKIVAPFFNKLNSKAKNGQYLIQFALNSESVIHGIKACRLVYVTTKLYEDILHLRITENTGSLGLNDKLLIIYDLNDKQKIPVVFAASMNGDPTIGLSSQEYHILRLLARGYNTEVIAYILSLSEHTTGDYRKSLLAKFSAKNVFQLIYHAQQKGFI